MPLHRVVSDRLQALCHASLLVGHADALDLSLVTAKQQGLVGLKTELGPGMRVVDQK